MGPCATCVYHGCDAHVDADLVGVATVPSDSPRRMGMEIDEPRRHDVVLAQVDDSDRILSRYIRPHCRNAAAADGYVYYSRKP